jgi:pSer/pThr/pTyr-binding forkhead associated (FHA) protein
MPIIGREHGAELVIRHPRVSARHAYIEPDRRGGYRLVDLNSANGTWVNGRRIAETVVTERDRVEIGSVAVDWNAWRAVLEAERLRPPGLTIGREPGNDIVIPDARVSAQHAEVWAEGPRLRIRDKGSLNGIYVNDVQVASSLVGRGDRVRFGTMPVDVFALMPAGRMPAATPTPAAGPVSPAPAAPGEARPVFAPAAAAPSSQSPWKIVLSIAVLLLVIGGVAAAAVFGTREDVVRRCEVCQREIFRQAAFFWEAGTVQAQAAKHRWCQADGDAPVTVHHRMLCEYCGKVHQDRTETRPRREEPKDETRTAGYCSDSCKALGVARDVYKEGKQAITEGVGNALRNLVK